MNDRSIHSAALTMNKKSYLTESTELYALIFLAELYALSLAEKDENESSGN